jgi:WD40 repeat protein
MFRAPDISGGGDAIVRVWDAMSGIPLIGALICHTAWVKAVAIGRVADRGIIVSGSADRTVRIWDPAAGAPLRSPMIGHASPGLIPA